MTKISNFYEEEEDAHRDFPTRQNPNFHDINKEEEDDDDDDVDHNSRPKNGSTSSDSTVEETSDNKKACGSVTGSVRPYVRSKNPRLRWTPDLHLRFVQAIERLGSQERATPKLVLQLMNVKGLSISHVKSHLQMYRSKKTDDPNQEQGLLSEGNDHHIFHLSQLPMLQSYNQRPLSNFRYQDGLWNPQANLNYNPFMGGFRHGVYGSTAREILARNNMKNCRWKNEQSINNTEESQSGLSKNIDGLSMFNQIRRKNTQIDTNVTITEQEKRVLKRKEIDQESVHDLDLNLSLKIKTPKEDRTNTKKGKDEFDENYLSLKLFSPSSSSSSVTRSKRAKTMGSSSLDLSL